MAKENKDGIDFEKIQSAIVDYIRFRKDALFVALMAAMSGSLLVILAFTILGSFDSQSSSDAKISELFLVAVAVFAIGLWLLIVSGVFLASFLHKRSEKTRAVHLIHSKLVHRSYLINFELVTATGKTRLEKLVNHLGLAFPEVKQKLKKLERKNMSITEFQKRQKSRKKLNSSDNYDLALRTSMGIFIIKIFDKTVTFEDVQSVVKKFNRQQINFRVLSPDTIERVIIVSNSYDDTFNTSELTEKMDDLKRRFKLDLILEEDKYGYATIWID